MILTSRKPACGPWAHPHLPARLKIPRSSLPPRLDKEHSKCAASSLSDHTNRLDKPLKHFAESRSADLASKSCESRCCSRSTGRLSAFRRKRRKVPADRCLQSARSGRARLNGSSPETCSRLALGIALLLLMLAATAKLAHVYRACGYLRQYRHGAGRDHWTIAGHSFDPSIALALVGRLAARRRSGAL